MKEIQSHKKVRNQEDGGACEAMRIPLCVASHHEANGTGPTRVQQHGGYALLETCLIIYSKPFGCDRLRAKCTIERHF